MFKTDNLVGRVCCENDNVVYMDVYTDYGNYFITQILISLTDEKPHFDESWIDKVVDTTIHRLTREQIINEIQIGTQQFMNIRKEVSVGYIKL